MLKKLTAIFFAILMLGTMSAFALEADTALYPTVNNGDFSNGATGWYNSNDGAISVATEGTYANTMAVVNAGGKAYGLAVQEVNFDFVPGESYTLEAKVANPTVDGKRANGQLIAYNYSTFEVMKRKEISVNGSEAWNTVRVSFSPTEKEDEPGVSNLSKLGIWLANYSSDTTVPLYFDDVKVYKTPLIENGDFENGGPTGLGIFYSDKSQVVTNDPDNAHSGNSYLRFVKPSDAHVYIPVTCKVNTTYKLTYWFKTNKQQGATTWGFPRVGVGTGTWDKDILDYVTGKTFYTTGVGNIPYFAGGDVWVKQTHIFKTPAPTGDEKEKEIYILLYGTGQTTTTTYYDDVTLEPLTNEVEIASWTGVNGNDIIDLSEFSTYNKIVAKARFVPETENASATMIAVVFDESQDEKRLEYIDVKSYSTTGDVGTLEVDIPGYTSFENKAVEVYLWDGMSGLSALTKKIRRTYNAA